MCGKKPEAVFQNHMVIRRFSGVPCTAGSRNQAFMFWSGWFFTFCSQRDLDKVCLED